MNDTRPNILWYCTDQQRYDTIASLGNIEIHTPNIDRLKERGVAFSRAYCQAPICTPSRASFLTGRYPASHHVHRNGNDGFPTSEKLVTRILADVGYDCGLVGKLHLSGAQGRVEKRNDDGYRCYYWSHHPYPDIEGNQYSEWLKNEKGVDPKVLYGGISGSYGVGVPTELHQTTWCSEMAIRFVNEQRGKPWMLSVNPFSPHPTFHPPKEYLDRYDPSKVSYPLFQAKDLERQKAFREIDQQSVEAVDPYAVPSADSERLLKLPQDQMASTPPSAFDARMMRACYYAEIELIDDQFGRIISALEDSGQLDNTVVIFMSDHGELLGDHGLLYKGCRFFESLVHVPLIVSFPAKFLSDVVSSALVELVDIAPTLLDIAGVDIPKSVQGTSLFSLLCGSSDTNTHKSHVVSEYNDAMGVGTVSDREGRYEGSHGTMYFDGRYKSIAYHGHDFGELYDLESDPGEFVNLWNDPGAAQIRCRIIKRHFDAIMATSDAGVRRTKDY